MVNGEQVLLLRIYPQNVHQPWPLALKSLRRAGLAIASALAARCSVRTRSDSLAFERVPPPHGTPRGSAPARGSTRVATPSPSAPAERFKASRGDPRVHGDGSVMLGCAILKFAVFL